MKKGRREGSERVSHYATHAEKKIKKKPGKLIRYFVRNQTKISLDDIIIGLFQSTKHSHHEYVRLSQNLCSTTMKRPSAKDYEGVPTEFIPASQLVEIMEEDDRNQRVPFAQAVAEKTPKKFSSKKRVRRNLDLEFSMLTASFEMGEKAAKRPKETSTKSDNDA